MRLIYLANNRIPSEKANSLQIMQMCQAFHRQGVQLELVVPRRVQPRQMRSVRDPFAYYDLGSRFPIVYLPCLDVLEVAPPALQHPAFALQSASFSLSVASYLARRRADMYYSRDPLSTVLLALMPTSVRARSAYEAHTFPKPGPRRRLHLWAARRLGKVVCITRGLAEDYEAAGLDPRRILVAPDAVELDRFAELPEKAAARARLGIPPESTIVAYAGHLYRWKGAHTLALASRHLPEGYQVLVVGGTEEDLSDFRRFLQDEGLERVRAVGHVSPREVPQYLAAADLLALPNSALTEASARYTSPMKLFEYMAAARPIVASRLPALQEVLRHRENAVLVEPDDPEKLAQAILATSGDESLSLRIATTARREALGRSWDARAKAVLSFLLDTQETVERTGTV